MTEPRDRALLPAVVWFVPAIMLLVALAAMPYGYYVLLRWITCGAFLLLVIQEHRLHGGASVWLVFFALLAVLFNPLFPVHLTREVWAPIDAGSALALAVHFLVRRRQTTSAPGETRSASPHPAFAKAAAPSPDPPPQAPVPETNTAPEQGTDSNALPAGYRLHEYEIVRALGAGGFGITYLAFDNNLKGPVAIKEYFYAGIAIRQRDGAIAPGSTRRAGDYEWGRTRFLDEAQALTRLDHPNIVRVRRYFPANNTAYIVMDYVEGESLAVFLEKHRTLTPAQWRPWLEALLDGLEHVHGHDYLHRDIKPENIVIRATDSQPVLVDFGAARRAAADKTQHLTAVHTPRYAPIEQYSTTSRQGPFTDIYSLAAVSYRALTGEPPPNAADRVDRDEFKPLTQRLQRNPDPLLPAIDSALAVRTADRPQNITAWRRLLNLATRNEGRNDRAAQEETIDANDAATEYLSDIFRRLGLRQKAIMLKGFRLFEVTVRDQTVRIPINRMREGGPAWDEIREYVDTIVVGHVWQHKFMVAAEEWMEGVEEEGKSWNDRLDHIQRDFLMCEANMFLLWHANERPTEAATLWCRGYDLLERMHRCLAVLKNSLDQHVLSRVVVHRSLPERKNTAQPMEQLVRKLENEIELVDREITSFRVRHLM